MEFALGAHVIARDGEKVGTVDSVVLDYNTKQVRQILVQQGIVLTSDKLIDIDDIDRVDQEGKVHLRLDSDRVNALPNFVTDQYQIVREDEMHFLPHAWAGGTGGAVPLFWGAGYTGRGYDPSGSMYEPAPADPPEMEPATTLPDTDIVLSTGTEVVGRDGDKLGTVDEIVYDENGEIAGFVVKAGLIFRHDVRVPADWIETISGDSVRLRVTAEEAESAGQST